MQLSYAVQPTSLVVYLDSEFDSEDQRRWQQVAVRRETVFGGGKADFEVVIDLSGAEECVSAVAAGVLCKLTQDGIETVNLLILHFSRGVSIHWTGLLDWTTGLTFLPPKIIFMPCN